MLSRTADESLCTATRMHTHLILESLHPRRGETETRDDEDPLKPLQFARKLLPLLYTFFMYIYVYYFLLPKFV